MAKKIKTIGIFTSGGDAPGLNAAIAGVVKSANKNGIKVLGIKNASDGLISEPPKYTELKPEDFSFYETRIAGTMLGAHKGKFAIFDHDIVYGNNIVLSMQHKKNNVPIVKKNIKKLKIDAFIATGGDSSAALYNELSKALSIPFILIPKTVDNDVPLTDSSIGFSTAVEVCVDTIDTTIPHAKSHSRWIIIETMGRDAGHIALYAGIAGNADIIILPEVKYSLKGVLNKIKTVHKNGRDFGVIVISEHAYNKDIVEDPDKNISISEQLADILKSKGINARALVVGHVQRAKNPNAFDRNLAFGFGIQAIKLLLSGKNHQMVCYKNNKISSIDLNKVNKIGNQPLKPDNQKLEIARDLNIYIGD
jgi:6-phosphofructokinase 1